MKKLRPLVIPEAPAEEAQQMTRDSGRPPAEYPEASERSQPERQLPLLSLSPKKGGSSSLVTFPQLGAVKTKIDEKLLYAKFKSEADWLKAVLKERKQSSMIATPAVK